MGLQLDARAVQLTYPLLGGGRLPVLDIDRFRVGAGETVGVTGPSGSGKTSLLHVLTGIERPERGRVDWSGVDVAALSENDRDRWRQKAVGFVFQDFHLFPGLSAIDNVLLPATFRHLAIPRQTRQRARALLAEVDIEPRPGPIATLSRGEMQRVAIARALLFSPPLIAADEPTASLDLEAGRTVTGLLRRLAREVGSTLLVVSHDSELLSRLDRVYSLMGGRLVPVRAAAAS